MKKQKTRAIESADCYIHVGQSISPGTTYVETFVDVKRSGWHTVAVESASSFELRFDGEQVLQVDRRTRSFPHVLYKTIYVQRGEHEVEMKLTSRDYDPSFSFFLLPTHRKGRYVSQERHGQAQAILRNYLQFMVAFVRGDMVQALQQMRPDMEQSAWMMTLLGFVTLAHPLRSYSWARDRAKALFEKAAKKDTFAWLPRMEGLLLKADKHPSDDVIDDFKDVITSWPDLIPSRLAFAKALVRLGSHAEAEKHFLESMKIVPNSCLAIQDYHDYLRLQGRVKELQFYAKALVRCDARSLALFSYYFHGRQWTKALVELERFAELVDEHRIFQLFQQKVKLARGMQKSKQIAKVLKQMIRLYPHARMLRVTLADVYFAQGSKQQAVRFLSNSIRDDSINSLRYYRDVLTGNVEFSSYRNSGMDIIFHFENSGHRYETSQVLVFDYAFVKVFKDFSSVVLTHQIYKVQSQEAMDLLGEFSLPRGAHLLNIATIKAGDKTRLEPDMIAGKASLSLPKLQIGDYVEIEYYRFLDPPYGGLSSALMGERFYFGGFDVPFHRSEMVLVVPQDMELTFDPRGSIPRVQKKTHAGFVEFRWVANHVPAFVHEPGSVEAKEYIPSIQWGMHASWDRFVFELRDALVDRSRFDPEALELADQIVSGVTSSQEQVKKIYHWVQKNIENQGDLFGEAARMVAERGGNPARVIHYLLGLLNIESKLVLARSIQQDQTSSEMMDRSLYQKLLVYSSGIWMQPGFPDAPFGYIVPFLKGQRGLVISPFHESKQVTWISLPKHVEGDDVHRITVDIQLMQNGAADVSMKESFRGYGSIQWRRDLKKIGVKALRSRLEGAYISGIFDHARVDSVHVTNLEDTEKALDIEYRIKVPSLVRKQENTWVLSPLFLHVFSARFASLHMRSSTQVVGPMDIELQVKIHDLKKHGLIAKPIPFVSHRYKKAHISMVAKKQGNTFLIHRNIYIPVMRIDAKDYGAWAKFCQKADRMEARDIVFHER